MTNRRRLLIAATMTALTCAAQARGEQTPLVIGYVDIADDPRHRPIMLGNRVPLKPGSNAWDGARAGLADAQSALRREGGLLLERVTAQSAEETPDAVRKLMRERGAKFILLDLPAHAYPGVAAAARGAEAMLFNVSAPDDELRRRHCAPELAHVYPSRAMLADAMAQYLVARNWRAVLLLEGPDPADAADAAGFAAAAKKFGARIVDRRRFAAGSDPRQRDQNNPSLATASTADYDVIYVADVAYDFARTLPFQTSRPRPVVGAVGLEATAWHWAWERNGAPQVNSRFRRVSEGAQMQPTAWAAWMAMRMVGEARARAGAEFSAQRNYILNGAAFDASKGVRVSFRRWDQQLRQPIMLASAQAAVISAPLPGFLHQTETLDTLGDDARESPCKMDR